MSQGKFSNPRPYREEEREIEQAYRKIMKKQKKVEAKAVQEATAGEAAFDETKFEQEFRQMTGQLPEVEAPTPDPAGEERQIEQAFRQVTGQEAQPVEAKNNTASGIGSFDYIPEDSDFLKEEQPPKSNRPQWVVEALEFYNQNTKLVLAALCAAALMLIVIVISVFIRSASDPYGGKILNNVYIGDIPVGGMKQNQAVDALNQAIGTAYTQDMVIDLAGTQLRLTPKDIGVALDAKAAVEAAYAYGRTGTKAERDKAYEDSRKEPHVIALLPFLNLNTDYIRQFLAGYAGDSGSTLVQATYGLEGNEPELSVEKLNKNAPCQALVITMGTPGVGFDPNAVYNQVLDAYSLRQFLVTVEDVESVKDPDPVDLEAIYKEFYIEPVNASIDPRTGKTTPGSYGYGFDLEAAQKLVDKANFGEEIRIPMEYIEPDVLDGDSFFRDTLGQYQTRCTGNDNRTTNLRLACEAINGTVLNPGETFSFNDTVGQRTSAKGYKSAPEDTGLESTLGGGVSQVSSTLYYAAMLSDLSVTSRTNLDRVPSYTDYGMDAAVSLKLRNNLSYPVKIEAQVSGGYVKIAILGTEDRDYYVTMDYTIANTYKPETEYEDFPYHNAEGYLDGDVLQEGVTGYQVKTYKVKYSNQTGAQIARDFVTNSTYNPVNQIVARVEEPVETTAPTEKPTKPTEEPTKPTETTPPTEATEPAETTQPTVPTETESVEEPISPPDSQENLDSAA